MILLAVATSSAEGSLALAHRQNEIWVPRAEVRWLKKAMHSELATVKLQELLASASVDFKELTHLAVVNGPGSFTGIRVGLNLARALAYGLGLKACARGSLPVLAHAHLQPGQSGLFTIKAIQNFHYAAAYRKGPSGLVELEAPHSLRTGAWRDSQWERFVDGETPDYSASVDATALIAELNSTQVQFSTWNEISPLYIRLSEAEEKMRQGLLKPV